MTINQLSCTYFDKALCRSCTLLALPASERDFFKLNKFKETIAASFPHAQILELTKIGPFPSRSKVKVSVSGPMHTPILGLASQTSSVELLDCPLHLQPLNEILHIVKKLIPEFKLAPYHIERNQGEFKGVILKSNEDASEVIVRFVLRSKDALSKFKKAARALQQELSFVKVVSFNIQPLAAALLEGEEEVFFTERRIIWENFGKFKLAFYPQSFSQVSHEIAMSLYQHVESLVNQYRIKSILDLYCGVGGFSFASAPYLDWGLGIEISKLAIQAAQKSCEENKTRRLKFESLDVENFLENYLGKTPDMIVVNPPRRGLSEQIIYSIKKLNPSYVVYSSCNPETLFRDLELLKTDYTVYSAKPFDMFPLTKHLEVLAFLKSNKLD